MIQSPVPAEPGVGGRRARRGARNRPKVHSRILRIDDRLHRRSDERPRGTPMTCRNALALALAGLCLTALTGHNQAAVHAQPAERPRLSVKPAPDFEVTGTGRTRRVAAGRVDRAPPAPAGRPPVRLALQDALLEHRPVFPHGRHGPDAHRHHERGLHGPVERGRVRGVPLDRRAPSRVLRVPRSRRSIASCRSSFPTSADSSWAGGPGTTRATA